MYLIGASGHAKVILDILQLCKIQVEGLFDKDDITSLCGFEVFREEDIEAHHELLIAIGNNFIRKQLALRFEHNTYGKAIHPLSLIAESVKIGNGSVIMGSATINPFAVVGQHNIINTSASVDHDCHLDDFVHVAPNCTLCGGISVGEGTLIGAGSTIAPNLNIGKWVTIGAGTVVIKDVPDFAVVVGNPGKVVKYNKV